MNYRLFYNKKHKDGEPPWILHEEETGLEYKVQSVTALAYSHTEEPSSVPLKSSYIVLYADCKLHVDHAGHAVLKYTGG